MGQPAKTTSAPAAGAANLITAWDRTTGSDSVVVAVIDTGNRQSPGLKQCGLNTAARDTRRSWPVSPGLRLRIHECSWAAERNRGGRGRRWPGRARQQSGRSGRCCIAQPTGRTLFATTTLLTKARGAAPSTWHGTHSAGVVAATANNATGIAGIGWNVKVLPVRALGRCGGAMSDVADAILWAAG